MNRRLATVSMALIAVVMFLMSCGGGGDNGSTSEKKVEKYTGPKVLHYYNEEPKTLDPQKCYGAPGIFAINMFSEGLYRSGKNEGEYIPGVAESHTFDQATNTYVFTLRSDAKWADGSAVTPADFVYGWKRALDQKTVYSFLITDFIKGAKEYTDYDKKAYLKKKRRIKKPTDKHVEKMTEKQVAQYEAEKAKLWKKVAIKAEGNTLTVELKAPAPFFLGLVAFTVYHPAKESFVSGRTDYGIEQTGILANGPWKITEWKHKDIVVLQKNEHYWNKDAINIDEIRLKRIQDVETRTNLLKTGDIDGSAIQAKDLQDFDDAGFRDKYHLSDMIDLADFVVFYVEYNHFNNKYVKNKNIRKAISYAMDRQSFVDKINLGDRKALALVPYGFAGLNKSFREEVGNELFPDNAKEKAKEYLAKGLKELRISKLPTLELITGESDISKKIGEKFQADWKEIGIDIKLVPVPWAEKLKRLQAGKFALSSSGWGPDYPDPMTYLDLFESTNGSNHGKYKNKKYDKLIRGAKKEKDPAKRMEMLYEAEKIVIEDMVISPQYFRVAHWTYKTYITGVIHRGIGASTDFYWADIDMDAKMKLKNTATK